QKVLYFPGVITLIHFNSSDRSWTVSRAEIEAKNFDLKSVNPNAKIEEDAWTPEELLDFIEQIGVEVAPGLGTLAAFMMYQFTNGNKPLPA
ncbi:MAG: hypothetical protein ACYTXY_55055, partial [Nostoc sp.]